MPKPREVKPWTIYPPTQEDREIIEQKAAAASLSVSAYLCMVGKLASIQVKTEKPQKALSELESAEPVPAPKKPAYTLHNSWGKLLTPEQAADVEKERACNKVTLVAEAEDGSGWKQYVCTDTGFDFVMRPVKEV